MWVVSVGDGRSGPAHLHHVAAHDLVALDRLGEGGGQIHHHVALPEREIHEREPVERSRELAQPLLDRHVERGERLRPDAARLLEAMARLEIFHRRRDRLVVDVAVRLVGGKILGDGEALTQQRHVGTLRPRHKLGARRQRRPPALHLQHRVAQHRRRDALDGALVECRVGRVGDQNPGLRRGLGLGGRWRRPWGEPLSNPLGENRTGKDGRGKQRQRNEPNRCAQSIPLRRHVPAAPRAPQGTAGAPQCP